MTAMLSHAHPLIMGILNVTPDSFSDGGSYLDPRKALSKGYELLEQGADLIDVGGESTRPGADTVDEDTQLSRVLPVIAGLHAHLSENRLDRLISIDTTRARVAESAVSAGAGWVNDVSAGTDDPEMFNVVARLKVPIVLMHRQGSSKTMQDNPVYTDVVQDVIDYLRERVASALGAGISDKRIIVDPGVGFGKTRAHNLQLIRGLPRLVRELGYPVLLGASRKRFMGSVCEENEPDQLLGATVATTALGVLAGVKVFRVHDVRENRQAARVTEAVLSS